jgi:hypothetical protein
MTKHGSFGFEKKQKPEAGGTHTFTIALFLQ